MKVLSSETIPSSVAFVDPNIRNLVDEVAVKVKAHLYSSHSCTLFVHIYKTLNLKIVVA